MFEDPIAQGGRTAAQAGAQVVAAYFADLASAGITDKTADAKSEGLVTAADVEAEKAIVDLIRSKFPNHSFLAEEAYSQTISAEHLWVIDPLDGTNNFAHGIPHFAVSVAYYHNGVAEYGIVIDVARGHVYESGRELGAWADGKQVYVNQHDSLSGNVTTCHGADLPLDRSSVLATNGRLHPAMLKIVSHYEPSTS